jgi:hypothetical protein
MSVVSTASIRTSSNASGIQKPPQSNHINSKGYATAFLPMNGGFSVMFNDTRGHHPLLVGSIPTFVG